STWVTTSSARRALRTVATTSIHAWRQHLRPKPAPETEVPHFVPRVAHRSPVRLRPRGVPRIPGDLARAAAAAHTADVGHERHLRDLTGWLARARRSASQHGEHGPGLRCRDGSDDQRRRRLHDYRSNAEDVSQARGDRGGEEQGPRPMNIAL